MTARREALLAFVVIATVAAHALFGRWGGWFRYEVYVLAVAVTGVIVLWHCEIDNFVRRARPRSVYLVGAGILVLGEVFYLRGPRCCLHSEPEASTKSSIRCIVSRVDFYRRPVAVNDLGWVKATAIPTMCSTWAGVSVYRRLARKARMITHDQGWNG